MRVFFPYYRTLAHPFAVYFTYSSARTVHSIRRFHAEKLAMHFVLRRHASVVRDARLIPVSR
jgi:uncharacterized membrane protein